MAAPDSVNRTPQRRTEETTFRSSMTSRQGHVAGRVVQGRIANVNMVNYTVDVVAQFDRNWWFNIRVASPYQHWSNGEGFFAVPEVGAVVMVTLPSDSSPPFVSAFVMPPENVPDASAPDAPNGTASHGNVPKYPTAVTFAGGRKAYTPGTLGMTGRDGQFVLLHRGGVLEVGATELAQRIYIPLANHVLDVSQRYSHHNVGGAVLWGMQEGPGLTDFPTTEVKTFRVMANDQYATVRIQRGNVLNPLTPEHPLPDTIVYEVAIIPTGFNADTGDLANTAAAGQVTYQFAFDQKGNCSMSVSGDVFAHCRKTLTLDVDGTLTVNGQADALLTFKNGVTLDGGSFATVRGGIVRLGAGTQSVARKGDLVTTKAAVIPLKCVILFPTTPAASGPCTLQILDSMGGVIVTGNDNVRA